jgi:hypothetical protein
LCIQEKIKLELSHDSHNLKNVMARWAILLQFQVRREPKLIATSPTIMFCNFFPTNLSSNFPHGVPKKGLIVISRHGQSVQSWLRILVELVS